MVVHSTRIEAHHDAHDDYWKLPNYEEYSRDQLRALLRSNGFIGASAPNRLRMKQLKSQHDRGLMPYHRYRRNELYQFCRQRHLPILSREWPGKAQLVEILEKADDRAIFNHFMNLPPELRVRIYTLYFEDMPVLEHPAQPPITKVSRLVRRESLPLFYSKCTSMLNADKYENQSVVWRLYDETWPRIKGDLFRYTPGRYLRNIRKLGIQA